MATVTPIVDRIHSAAECLSIPAEKLTSTLRDYGVQDTEIGQKILDSSVTTEEDLVLYLNHFYGINMFVKPSVKAAAAILKGRDPFVPVVHAIRVEEPKEDLLDTVHKAIEKEEALASVDGSLSQVFVRDGDLCIQGGLDALEKQAQELRDLDIGRQRVAADYVTKVNLDVEEATAEHLLSGGKSWVSVVPLSEFFPDGDKIGQAYQNPDPVLESVLQDPEALAAVVAEEKREKETLDTPEQAGRVVALCGDPNRVYKSPNNLTPEELLIPYEAIVVGKVSGSEHISPVSISEVPDGPVKIKEHGHKAEKVGQDDANAIKKEMFTISKPKMPSLEASQGTELTQVELLARLMKDIHQLKDRELLDLYIREREYDVEQELHRRAKNQHWVVLKTGPNEPGKEAINVEASLDLLRSARRRTNPTMFPVGSAVVPVYRITELNLNDRMIELCPICGASLCRGYCEKCALNFSGVGDLEKGYVHMIAQSESFDRKSFSDRRAVWVSAGKGLEDLYKTWPSIIKKFEEAKATDTLPRLKIIESRPSAQVADPFHVSGHRQY